MSEGIELPESYHLHEDHPLVLPVSLTISIMAVFVAACPCLVTGRTRKGCASRQKRPAAGPSIRRRASAFTKLRGFPTWSSLSHR